MTDAIVSESGQRLKPLSLAMLRELSGRSNLRGVVQSLGHYGMIVLVGTVIWLVSSRYGVLWAPPLMAMQGYLVAFLFMAVHETAHKTAFESRSLNLAVGYLSGFVIGLPYEYYCLFHWDHHRYTQDPGKDPELIVGVKPKSDTQLAIAYSGLLQVAARLRLMLGHAVTGKVVVPWIPENKRATIVTEARIYVALYTLLLALSLWCSSPLLLWVWIVPLIIGQFFLRPYLYAEHTGCERTRSAFQNTRTTYTGAVVKWIAWNMPYHVEHHAYPSIPFHALPKLNGIIDGEIVHRGRGYIRTTRETWSWFRRHRQTGN
ncbi:fatty acid desaturase [Bradyrhizobium arachidis]|uniref:fatty acid desaturase n=1 Tax=Bradyrhizobium TaxID=374 RepID=UPI002163A53B|nr:MULTISPECIES: fatty acid desaturase [Bradyrhizobium]MDN4984266.1 fatty acid desaturase [Bradyrhizobium sp. WYCCWR 13022]UVO36439.1 fatty acid desaturase [Bradyrhizobium arachidis]